MSRTVAAVLILMGLWLFLGPFLAPVVGLSSETVPASDSAGTRPISRAGMAGMRMSGTGMPGMKMSGATMPAMNVPATKSGGAGTMAAMGNMRMIPSTAIVINRGTLFFNFLPGPILYLIGIFYLFRRKPAH